MYVKISEPVRFVHNVADSEQHLFMFIIRLLSYGYLRTFLRIGFGLSPILDSTGMGLLRLRMYWN